MRPSSFPSLSITQFPAKLREKEQFPSKIVKIINYSAQFSWYSWVALSHEFTSSTKTNYKNFSFPTETENRNINEIISPQKKQKSYNPRKLALPKVNDSTVLFCAQLLFLTGWVFFH